jgi:serpin B
VKVDETGTEAAAATAVIMGVTAMPLEPVEVRVDHPFLYLIYDQQTGAILFMGRVLNPA